MRALTEIGEVGIEVGGRAYLLRPSLSAMSGLGTPAQIVATFADVMSDPPQPGVFHAERFRTWSRNRFRAALAVLTVCCADDLSELIGVLTERGTYRPGRLPMDHIVLLAAELLRHGIVGVVPRRRRSRKQPQGSYSTEFRAVEYATLAVVHLGKSDAEAWQMTMTSFLRAMDIKFPETGTSLEAPTLDEYDETMAWLARIDAAEAAKNG